MSQAPSVVAPSFPPQDAERVVHRITLHGVPWALYEQLLGVIGDGLPRVTYDRGALELERPSEEHETLRWLAGRLL